MEYSLKNRYYFTGTLVMETGLHIGSGQETFSTDSAVIRDAT